MSSDHLTRIPARIEQFFPNLIGLQWYNGGATTIVADDIKPFGDLEELYVFQTHLNSLDGDLFNYSQRLRMVFFSNNQLEHVGHNLLQGMPQLTQAHFNSNPCIDSAAVTPAEIEELNIRLPIVCPPLGTTTDQSTTEELSSTSEFQTTSDLIEVTTEALTTELSTITESSTEITESSTITESLSTTEFSSTNSIEITTEVITESITDPLTSTTLIFPTESFTESSTTSQISISDPPTTTISATTETAECSIGCVELVESLRVETRELREVIEIQVEENAKLIQEIAMQGEAIAELEKQMRELWVHPCSPCLAASYKH